MKPLSSIAKRLCWLGLTAALGLSSCGEGTITFGGNPDNGNNDSIVVIGDIDDVQPPNASRDVVVFVYVDLDPSDIADGPPFNANGLSDAETVLVAADDTFSLSDIQSGTLTIVFLRDDIVADGSLDAGDSCAVVFDENNRLDDVNAGRQVDIQLTDIFFDANASACNANNGELPAQGCGCALPLTISINILN